jgi:hypothetical protein
MTRSLVPLFALFALACGAQDAAPPADAPPDAPEAAAKEAPPDRTATEAADAEAVKEPGAAAPELPSFEGDHAMAKTDAVRVSLEWLALVDAGDYGAGWDASASVMQDAAPKEQFGQSVGAARGPMGAVKSRSFAKAEYATALPGAPDGEYVVIQYNTVFENKAEAVETITPMMDWDGMWKVSGYYLK